MITHHTPAEHNDRALRHSPVVPGRLSGDRVPLSRKDRLSITALAAVTLLYGGVEAAPAVGEFLNPANHHEFTNEQLHNRPQQPVVVKAGDTVDSIVRSVDPELANDPQGRADVEAYVAQEGIGPHHTLDQLQQVLVPLTHDQNK